MNSKTYYFHDICNIKSSDNLTPEARLELIQLCNQQETTDKIESGTCVYLEEGIDVFIDDDGDVCIVRCWANSIKKGVYKQCIKFSA